MSDKKLGDQNITIPNLRNFVTPLNYQIQTLKTPMSKRITIMIDNDLDKKLRTYQAKQIEKFQKTYSYSKAINDILRKSLK